MSLIVSSVLNDELGEWVQAAVESGAFRSKSELIARSVAALRLALELPTSASLLDRADTAQMADEIARMIEQVRLPVVSPGSGGRAIATTFSHGDARLIDQLVADPDLPHRTHADIIRALIHCGLMAVNTVKSKLEAGEDNDITNTWRSLVTLARAETALADRLYYAEQLERQSRALYEGLVWARRRDDRAGALTLYLAFYHFAEALRDDDLRFEAERVLAELPIAAAVAFEHSDVVPNPLLVPAEAPESGHLLDNDALFQASIRSQPRPRGRPRKGS